MSDVLPWTRSVRRADGWPMDDFWCPVSRSTPGWAYELVSDRGEVLDRAMSLRVARRAAITILGVKFKSGGRKVSAVDIVGDGVRVERMRPRSVERLASGSLT